MNAIIVEMGLSHWYSKKPYLQTHLKSENHEILCEVKHLKIVSWTLYQHHVTCCITFPQQFMKILHFLFIDFVSDKYQIIRAW